MAVGDIRLSTNRYVRPGTYIGRVHQPAPAALSGNPRFPSYVGRGSRLAREANSKHIRSRVYAESLNFSTTAPYIAPLDHDAANDQTLSVLQKSSGEPVPYANWRFTESVSGSNEYDQVQIDDTVFDVNTTYQIEYQSVDRAVQDDLQFDDVREVILVGDADNVARYIEFSDYRIVTVLTGDATDTDALVADSSNSATSGSTSPAAGVPIAGNSTGTVTIDASTNYSWPYSRTYTITCVAAAGTAPNRTAEFEIGISAISGGNSQTTNLPFHTSATTPIIQIDEAAGTNLNRELDNNAHYKVGAKLPAWWPNDGIVVDFTFGAADPGFDSGTPDVFTITAYGPGLVEFSSAHNNTNQFSSVATPAAAAANTSGSAITINTETDYDDDFDRSYTLYCSAVGGAAPNRTATIQWTGYDELPFSEGSFSLVEATASTLSQQLMEKEIYLDFAFGTEHALADTTNSVTAADSTSLATALTLATNLKAVYNAHDANTGGVWHTAGAGTHQIAAAAPIDLVSLRTICIELAADYALHLADTTMHVVADAQHTLTYTPTSSSTLAQLVAFLNDFKDKYDAHRVSTGFVVSDYWTVAASAARREYTAKDDRSYEITINTVTGGTSVQFTYNAKTYEGSWGTKTILASGGTYEDPYSDLPDNVRLMFRNIDDSYAANDKFTFAATCSDVVDWTLVRRASETISSSDIQLDVSGNVTGTALSYFLILDETPSSVLRVKESVSGTHLSYSQVSGTPYIYFATDPGVDVHVDYEWRGYEPDPGQPYFITANRKRDDDEFNEPIRYLTVDEAREGLYPSATNNHLWIMAEIAFETGFFGGYFIQVQSPADNEVYSISDYRNAIDATETKDEITDLIVLSYFDALGYSKISIEQMNDPFEGKNRLLWVGTPIGTAVGDDSTPGTLVYLARNTLQFSPNSQGKGNVILIANNQCTRTQALEDGSTTTLTLDGSFIAGHAAALTASFTDPADTILKKDIASFDTVTGFTESEITLIGGASITYLNEKGTALYEYGESVTVDTTEVALNEISARTQEHFVLKRIKREMNDALLALVPPSPSAGVLMVQNQLVQSLGSMASSGIIAPYGSDEGTIRPISPTDDVFVYVDELDDRLYHFGYYFTTRLPIKRLFGLYSANTRFWDNRSLSAPS